MSLLMGVSLLLDVGEVFPSLTCEESVFVMQKSSVYTVAYTSKRWTVGVLEAGRPLYSVWNGGPGGNVCWSLT
jgi:hypothetical protein